MYKVLLLSDANSAHTQKWALALNKRGIKVAIFSLSEVKVDTYKTALIEVFVAKNKLGINLFKTSYFFFGPSVRSAISVFKPNIVHAHYASSYGYLGVLSRFHPFIISVWGTDVYSFPGISPLHKWILKYNLGKAETLLATGYALAGETGKYTTKPIKITPFGIDTDRFKPISVKSIYQGNDIVIGIVKALEKIYGINFLIDAFALIKGKFAKLPLKLLIVGSGSELENLEQQVEKLGLKNDTLFTGFIAPDKVADYHNMMSVAVFPSLQESFGVSVLEASACAKPVIVSNVGGLPEVVEDGKTGIIVPPANVQKLAEAIEKLILDGDLRYTMGNNGRTWVEKNYKWENCVNQMVDIYDDVLKKTGK